MQNKENTTEECGKFKKIFDTMPLTENPVVAQSGISKEVATAAIIEAVFEIFKQGKWNADDVPD